MTASEGAPPPVALMPVPSDELGSARAQALHIVVLTSFAVLQPILDLLGQNPTFFVAHGSTPAAILVLLALLILVPPALILPVKAVASLISPRLAVVVHLVAVGTLLGLTIIPPFARAFDLEGWLAVVVFVLVAAAGAFTYLRFRGLRTLLTWAAPAPLIFAGVFLLVSPVRSLMLPGPTNIESSATDALVPVVLVIFDELALHGLLDEEGEINDQRFPGFGRLAGMSTWFPNATTVHPQSRVAVTSILTGIRPAANAIPVVQEFPQNVFTVLDDSYSIHAREAMTSLCPPSSCEDEPPSGLEGSRFESLAADIVIAYLHSVIPEDIGGRYLPTIGDRWAGFVSLPTTSEVMDRTLEVIAARGEDLWLRKFHDSIAGDDPQTLLFLHSALPHAPWRYLPTGQVYENDSFGDLFENPTGDVWLDHQRYSDQGLQRFFLQTQFVDRFVDDLLDKLAQEGIVDESLLIVLADHGISFEPGTARRALDQPVNGDAILPIPLFVKFPDQSSGAVDMRNAQTIDVLPTIADVLGITLSEEVDGASLAAPATARQPLVVTTDGEQSIRTDTYEAAKELALQHLDTFGDGSEPFDVYAMGPNRHLVGNSVEPSEVAGEPPTFAASITEIVRLTDVDPEAVLVPARITGAVTENPETDLVLALNNTIASVASPYLFPDTGEWRFSFFVSPTLMQVGCNELLLYRIVDDGLEPLPLQNGINCS